MTRLHNRDKLEFEKFGVKFIMGVVTETRDKWVRAFVNSDTDEPVDASAVEKMSKEEISKLRIDWMKTDDKVPLKYTEWVKVIDPELGLNQSHPLNVYSTPDGPIMGIETDNIGESYTLFDPCVIQYSSSTGKIGFAPIFNVARTLNLRKSAVRSVQPPAEILVAAYPGFMIQNRMLAYQLKPATPLVATGPVDNDVDELVELLVK